MNKKSVFLLFFLSVFVYLSKLYDRVKITIITMLILHKNSIKTNSIYGHLYLSEHVLFTGYISHTLVLVVIFAISKTVARI